MRTTLARAALATLSAMAGAAIAAPDAIKDALDGEKFGLMPASAFRQATGACKDCPTVRQGLWYFRDDLLAVPREKNTAAPLVWLGSPLLLEGATLDAAGQLHAPGGAPADFKLAGKIGTNRSYWNSATTAWFAQRPLRLRGSLDASGAFVARTVWPQDFTLQPSPAQPLGANGLQDFVRKGGGAYATRVIWERQPGQSQTWADKPVIGIMLNGAQGDDDEAFGGHFAIATGSVGPQGGWSNWLVNNFYNLDSVSEKGIIAAPVPMDNYLMDLNSGQQFYRPSTMLVAVLSHPRTAAAYQQRIGQVFERFYRHDFTYRHAAANCAGISVDALRDLGWNVPLRGPTSRVKALGGYALFAAKDLSLHSGRKTYDYLTEEQVRLYPAVAFDALGNDLLALASGKPQRTLTEFERQLAGDVEALVLVNIPQVPSSRAMGSAPVYSIDEFMARTPPDRADWKIVPTAPRPFPAELAEATSRPDETPFPVPLPVGGIAVAGLAGAGAFWRRRRK
ncbi:MAG: hypothetical protein ACLGI6_10310 [Gammaproteobacteria bacterium]